MATEILRPDGAGDETNLTIGGSAPAATNWESVDESTSDANTTYVSNNGTSYVYDSYALQATALTTETIDQVDAFARARVAFTPAAGDEVVPGVRLSATNVMGTDHTLTNGFSAYSDTVARPGGGSWAVSDLDSLQARVGLRESGTSDSRATQVWVQITYTASTVVKDIIGSGIIPFAR